MKQKKLITLFVLFPLLVYGAYGEGENNNTTSGQEGNPTEQAPPGPPPGVENEVENAESPVNQQLEALEDQLEAVIKQRNKLLEDLKDANDDLDDLEDAYTENKAAHAKQKNEILEDLNATKEDLDDIKGELDDTREDLSDTKEDLEELEDDFRTANNTIHSLLVQRIQMSKDIDEMADILNKGPGSLFNGWVWSPDLGWVYISPTIVPYAFSQTDGWMFYDTGSNPRRVYYYTTKKWRVLDTQNEDDE